MGNAVTNPEYDSVAETYNDGLEKLLGPFGKDSEKYARYKIEYLVNLLDDHPKSILDFGCGIGRSLLFIQELFGQENTKLYGCDVSKESIRIASEYNPQAEFFHDNTVDQLMERNERYDLVLLACVLHHIEPSTRKEWLEAISRKLNPGGGYCRI